MPDVAFACLEVLGLHLALFASASNWASRAAGRSVSLFASACEWGWLAALGFRLAFALALLSPLAQTSLPALRQLDPLWHEAGGALRGVSGHVLAIMGTMLDWAGQVTMGASWRVGAAQSALGGLVTEGLYRVSHDPVFADQLLLLLGVALALPSVPTMVAALLFWWAAGPQIESEERHLEARWGESYRANQSRVARWRGAPGCGVI